MKLQVMCVYDSVAKVFFRPFYVAIKEVGIRSFAAACNDAATELSRSPADYSLWHVAEFDDESGRFDVFPQNVHCGVGSSFVSKGDVHASQS